MNGTAPVYHQARFLLSAPDRGSAPPDEGIEVAFAGRSNAGKSSAINVITQQTGLARTSKTPGRTQQIVFFELDDQRRLVDLPGYGFAAASKSLQRQWARALEDYMQNRECLRGVVMMMDIRRPFTDLDVNMLEWCEHIGLPVHILLTKADKLRGGAARQTLKEVRETLANDGFAATAQLFSALKKEGCQEVHRQLDQWFELGGDAD